MRHQQQFCIFLCCVPHRRMPLRPALLLRAPPPNNDAPSRSPLGDPSRLLRPLPPPPLAASPSGEAALDDGGGGEAAPPRPRGCEEATLCGDAPPPPIDVNDPHGDGARSGGGGGLRAEGATAGDANGLPPRDPNAPADTPRGTEAITAAADAAPFARRAIGSGDTDRPALEAPGCAPTPARAAAAAAPKRPGGRSGAANDAGWTGVGPGDGVCAPRPDDGDAPPARAAPARTALTAASAAAAARPSPLLLLS